MSFIIVIWSIALMFSCVGVWLSWWKTDGSVHFCCFWVISFNKRHDGRQRHSCGPLPLCQGGLWWKCGAIAGSLRSQRGPRSSAKSRVGLLLQAAVERMVPKRQGEALISVDVSSEKCTQTASPFILCILETVDNHSQMRHGEPNARLQFEHSDQLFYNMLGSVV